MWKFVTLPLNYYLISWFKTILSQYFTKISFWVDISQKASKEASWQVRNRIITIDVEFLVQKFMPVWMETQNRWSWNIIVKLKKKNSSFSAYLPGISVLIFILFQVSTIKEDYINTFIFLISFIFLIFLIFLLFCLISLIAPGNPIHR